MIQCQTGSTLYLTLKGKHVSSIIHESDEVVIKTRQELQEREKSKTASNIVSDTKQRLWENNWKKIKLKRLKVTEGRSFL